MKTNSKKVLSLVFVFSLFFIFLFSLSFVSAELGFHDNNLPRLDREEPTQLVSNFINNTNITNINTYNNFTFNATQFSDDSGFISILESWLDSLYCRLTGCSMTGNLETTGNVTAEYFIGDGSLLTGISGGNGTSLWQEDGTDTELIDSTQKLKINSPSDTYETRIYLDDNGNTYFT